MMGAIGYLVVAAACLVHWDAADKLRYLDVFSVSVLAFSFLLAAEQTLFHWRLPARREVTQEAYGMTFDPQLSTLTSGLALIELLVFFDYGHTHWLTYPVHPSIQTFGIFMYLAAVFWLNWVDGFLAREFNSMPRRSIIREGPFSYIRHPRYLGLLVSRVAFAMTMSSVLAAIVLVGWLCVVLRRIHLEERHLLTIFGEKYKRYSQESSRLVPGLF